MITLSILFSTYGFANDVVTATIHGETYLGVSGASVKIIMNNEHCSISTIGNELEGGLEMSLQCGSNKQVLWDKQDGFTDEPRFELLRAGDFDKDGKIDLEMEMSPKYSCLQQVTFLSTKSLKEELVGVGKKSKLVCG